MTRSSSESARELTVSVCSHSAQLLFDELARLAADVWRRIQQIGDALLYGDRPDVIDQIATEVALDVLDDATRTLTLIGTNPALSLLYPMQAQPATARQRGDGRWRSARMSVRAGLQGGSDNYGYKIYRAI